MTILTKFFFTDQHVEKSPTGNYQKIDSARFELIGLLMAPIRGAFSILLYAANTIFWCLLLFLVALFKITIPNQWIKLHCDHILNGIANAWIQFNLLNQNITAKIRWDIKGVENLSSDAWYLLVANHQSWVDILVLQKVFYKKVPFIKFFLKKELIWVPFLGLAWWALDFPFMKRYTAGYLKKNPHKKGKDLDITRKACEKFKRIPISIMTFIEGTRLTKKKHKRQKSPYKYLLRPKAGGIAFTLAAMGNQLNRLLDVTIVYPSKGIRFWDFACGRINEIKVRVRSIALDDKVRGDYINDSDFKRKFQRWLNEIWLEKDARIDYLLSSQDEKISI